MKRCTFVVLLLASLCISAAAQKIAVAGNSLARYQAGFQGPEFPHIPSRDVNIWGQDGLTCADLVYSKNGAPPLLLGMTSADDDVDVLYLVTNDVLHNILPPAHVSCVTDAIAELNGRNPNVQIVLVNEHPFRQGCGLADYRPQIAAMNQAYATANWPSFVHVVDEWTPNALPSGYGDPRFIQGPYCTHPGWPSVWSLSWGHFASPVEAMVNQVKP